VLLVIFILVELRLASPLVDVVVNAKPALLLTNVASTCVGFALFATAIGTSSYMQAPKATGYGFGLNVLATNIIRVIGFQADRLIMGYFLGAADLGYYSVAQRVVGIVTDFVAGSTERIVVPLFARIFALALIVAVLPIPLPAMVAVPRLPWLAIVHVRVSPSASLAVTLPSPPPPTQSRSHVLTTATGAELAGETSTVTGTSVVPPKPSTTARVKVSVRSAGLAPSAEAA
jgi:hypothetical protein